jgi:EmrB/QacA subfamily drug resistance transporter
MAAVRMGTSSGRWIIAAAVLGSGAAFLDATVVNVALPAIAEEFESDLASLQWVLTAYLLTLGSLLVLGGSLGDLYGRRRVFVIGLLGFGLASALCGLAPTAEFLIAARALQGVAAALLVPGSLALISATFHPDDRARAIGAWSGLAGVSTAIGPFVGGWLVDAVSWRLVFLINLPIVLVAAVLAIRHVEESASPADERRVDVTGAVLLSAGLAGLVYALIEQPVVGWSVAVVITGVGGVVALVGFVVTERLVRQPMVPLDIFRSQQFSGANAVTLTVYASFGAALALLTLHLQVDLGYSALEAGAALLPVTLLMLVFSSRAGALAQRIGPRLPMTLGPLVIAGGLLLLRPLAPGSTYVAGVLPGVMVLGIGLSLTVAPLTATVLAAIPDERAGVGSAINNAVARIASLLAIAVVPAAAGIATSATDLDLTPGFARAMAISAALAVAGSVTAAATIRRAATVRPTMQGESQPCLEPCVEVRDAA